MTDPHHNHPNPQASENLPSSAKPNREISNGAETNYYRQKPHYPNPPEITNPDSATLRDQWRFAIRQYSKWYSHAWGTAILAGLSFFALGWVVKGSNPISSFNSHDSPKEPDPDKPKPAD